MRHVRRAAMTLKRVHCRKEIIEYLIEQKTKYIMITLILIRPSV